MPLRTVPVSTLSENRRRAELSPDSPAKQLMSQPGDTKRVNDGTFWSAKASDYLL
jgi:hypothetical protein